MKRKKKKLSLDKLKISNITNISTVLGGNEEIPGSGILCLSFPPFPCSDLTIDQGNGIIEG